MWNTNNIQKVEIDNQNKKLYVYYREDSNMVLAIYPPRPVKPSYYREVYSFDNLEFIEREYAVVERGYETITYKQ
jgi:hypothetical protein